MLRQFTSKLADGTWETGAFCPLDLKQYNQNGGSMVMIDLYHGKVLGEREANYYDDSDFYATVWDDEKNAPKEVMWATTRGWTYACGCTIDATDEVKRKYAAYKIAKARQDAIEFEKLQKHVPKIGKTIRSTTTRGKAFKRSGVVDWIGSSQFSEKCVRFIDTNGHKLFVDVTKIEVLDEETNEWVKAAYWSRTFKTWQLPL